MALPNRTRIQVATLNTFTEASIVFEIDGAYDTTIEIPNASLPINTQLYARAMHGHPDTGDSAWSAVIGFKVKVPYGNTLYYSAGDFTFTVPANITNICVAMTPGADYSAFGALLKAYKGRTIALNGSQSIPAGVASIYLSGKGADGTNTLDWTYTSKSGPTSIDTYPTSLGSSAPTSITARIKTGDGTIGHPLYSTVTFPRTALTATRATYTYEGFFRTYDNDTPGTWIIIYDKTGAVTNGAATTCVVNGTTFTFPGGVGGAAAVTNHTVAVNAAAAVTLSTALASGGYVNCTYSAYALGETSSLVGDNFDLSPVDSGGGTYTGGLAAWKNNITVTPGQQIAVHLSSGAGINVIWGTGRTFPNSET